MSTETVTVGGKQYTFKVLSTLEYDDIIDNADRPMKTQRKLLAASLGLSEAEVGAIPTPDKKRLDMEFGRIHAPKVDIAPKPSTA